MSKLNGQPAHMTQPRILFSCEDRNAERVFKDLEQSLAPRLWPRAKRSDNPTHYVHVVVAQGCRLELGQELSAKRMEEILVQNKQKEVFVLVLHLGMRAPAIQFTSPYGDRIKIGQVVYTDRRPPLLELVVDAEGAPLSVCRSKFDAFLQSGNGGAEDSRNRNNAIHENKTNDDLDMLLPKDKKRFSRLRSSKPNAPSSSSPPTVPPDFEAETLSSPQSTEKKKKPSKWQKVKSAFRKKKQKQTKEPNI